MSDVAAFLRARLDDDMESAGFLHVTDCDHPEDPFACRCDCGVPQRVLRDVEAKRRIVTDYERVRAERKARPDDLALAGALLALHGAVRALAGPFSDHPDYDPAWSAG